MKVLVVYGTELSFKDDGKNLAYDVGELVFEDLKDEKNIAFIREKRRQPFLDFHPNPVIKDTIDEMNITAEDRIVDIYSVNFWGRGPIGLDGDVWEGESSPPEFLIEAPQNKFGSFLAVDKKTERGIISSDYFGDFMSFLKLINSLPYPNYYPVFISCNDIYLDEKRNPDVRKKLLAEELKKLVHPV